VTDGPLIVQSDKRCCSKLIIPLRQARMAIAPFAELERAPSMCTPTG